MQHNSRAVFLGKKQKEKKEEREKAEEEREKAEERGGPDKFDRREKAKIRSWGGRLTHLDKRFKVSRY